MRYTHAITAVDGKLLDAIADLEDTLRGKTETAILSFLTGKWEDNSGISRVPIRFPTSLADSIIEFYDLAIDRLLVIPRNKYPKEDFYQLKAPEQMTEVTKIYTALDKLDEKDLKLKKNW